MDIWGGVKKALSVGAPLLADAIVPGAGGLAASLVAKALGVEKDPAAIEARLRAASPEDWAKLQAEEHRHEERLIELGTENDKAHLADRQDARQREIGLTKITGKRDGNLYALAWTVVVGFFILCFRADALPGAHRHQPGCAPALRRPGHRVRHRAPVFFREQQEQLRQDRAPGHPRQEAPC